MNRKNFLKNCLALGVTFSLSDDVWGSIIEEMSNYTNKIPFEDIMAIDAHSHPYHFHTEFINGRFKHM